MISLHGTWVSTSDKADFFLIWGENPGASKKKGRKRNTEKIPKHPLLATTTELENAVQAIDPSNYKDILREQIDVEIGLILPAAEDKPILSAQPTRTGSVDRDSLKPWAVEGIGLNPGKALTMLASMPGNEKNFGDYAISPDLQYWCDAARFAIELLVRQQFIPDVTDGRDGNTYVKWKHVLLDDAGREKFSALADSMPSASVLVTRTDERYNRKEILSHFLDSAIDSFIRKEVEPPQLKAGKNSLSGAWMSSLCTGEGIKAPREAIKTIGQSMRSWKSGLENNNRSFRTCFALEPPELKHEDDTGLWSLKYYIQAIDDPTLLIPAGAIWKESRKTLNYLNRKFENPQEKLLEDLGRASKIFPPVEYSLSSARPDMAKFDMDRAYSFLREIAPAFQGMGFGVLLPDWYKGAKQRVSVKLNVRPKSKSKESKGMFSLDTIVEYDWKLAIGDDEISEEEFMRLSKLKEPIVSMGGKWVVLSKEDAERAIKALKAARSGEMPLSEALRMEAGAEEFMSMQVSGLSSSGWVSDVLEQLKASDTMPDLPAPAGLNGTLRHYQVKGYSWLDFMKKNGMGCILADDMGLGKTVQLLASIQKDKEAGIKGTTLLVCPTSVAGNWLAEARKFTPDLKIHVHYGSSRAKKTELKKIAKENDLIVTTYALVHRDEEILKGVKWKSVVLDEAQSIKNPYTKQCIAIKSLEADHRIAMTGTPVENRLSELWSIMDFLNPGYLGSIGDFRKKFAIPVERYDDGNAAGNLKRLVRPFILRRVKTDPTVIKDLPEKIETKERCGLTREQATLYEAIVDNLVNSLDGETGIKRKGLVLSALMRLKQVCDHPSIYLEIDRDAGNNTVRSDKLKRMTELIEESIAEGDRSLVFTQFVSMGDLLQKHFKNTLGEESLFLHGGLPAKERQRLIARFSEEDSPKIFILSLKAGGVGLNLTSANRVFHYDRWWNPAVEDQATDRAFRIGQRRNVMVHKFVCEGTIEEKIDEMIESKKSLASSIIGSGDDWITELSTDRLKEMLMLRKDTIRDE